MISIGSNENSNRNEPTNTTNIENKSKQGSENQTPKEEKIQINFVKSSLISKHLMCIICTEVFNEPKRTGCGHTFCDICITQWLSKTSKCPICRDAVSKEEMSKDLIAYNIINDLEVTCSNAGIY